MQQWCPSYIKTTVDYETIKNAFAAASEKLDNERFDKGLPCVRSLNKQLIDSFNVEDQYRRSWGIDDETKAQLATVIAQANKSENIDVSISVSKRLIKVLSE